MHWVYILKLENYCYYIGETIRLFTRLNEHHNPDKSSKHCQNHKPKYLFGIYNVEDDLIYKYYSSKLMNKEQQEFPINDSWIPTSKQYALNLENEITLQMMKLLDNRWFRVRGGKYCKDGIANNPSKEVKLSRPFCNCEFPPMPAEIHRYENKIYFRCVKKGMEWIDGKCNIEIPHLYECCDFYMEITKENNYFHNNFKEKTLPSFESQYHGVESLQRLNLLQFKS